MIFRSIVSMAGIMQKSSGSRIDPQPTAGPGDVPFPYRTAPFPLEASNQHG
jgi:hypothetical protein